MARVLKIYFHDACFDGTTSAALFAAFYRDVIDSEARIEVIGMQHRDGDPFAVDRIEQLHLIDRRHQGGGLGIRYA